jgi:NADPH:quinone reductase-like Zn-dependent oxidoreductase
MDVAGTVEAVGGDVTRFQPGDAVFGWADGSFAEYATAPSDQLAPMPASLSFEQAGAVPISGFAARLRRALILTGTLVIVGSEGRGQWLGGFDRNVGAVLLSRFVGQRLRMLSSSPRQKDLQTLRELAEAGKLTPVVDRTYPLAEVPAAMRDLEAGHVRGKLVITV